MIEDHTEIILLLREREMKIFFITVREREIKIRNIRSMIMR